MSDVVYLLRCNKGLYYSTTMYKDHLQVVDLDTYLQYSVGTRCKDDYINYLNEMSRSERNEKQYVLVEFVKKFSSGEVVY